MNNTKKIIAIHIAFFNLNTVTTEASEFYNRITGEYTAKRITALTQLPSDKAKIRSLKIIDSPNVKRIPDLEQMVNLEIIDLSNGNMSHMEINQRSMAIEDLQLQTFMNLARKKLHTIVLPNSYKNLYTACLANCLILRRLTAHTVEYLGANALQNCISLEELILPNVIRMGEKALSGCTSLKLLTISPLINKSKFGMNRKSHVESCVTPSTFLGTPLDCIVKRQNFPDVRLRQFIEELSRPIYNESIPTNQCMNNWISSYKNNNPALNLSFFHFMYCIGLKRFEAQNIIFVPPCIFMDNHLLEYIDVRNALTLDTNAFANCISLKKICINQFFNRNNVDFNGRLRNPKQKHEIAYAIPPSAFTGVPMTCEVIRPTMPTLSLYAFFQELSSNVFEKILYVDDGQYSNYDRGTWISSYKNPISTVLKRKAFSGCTPLLSIDIPNAKSIDSSALENCTNLSFVNAIKVECIACNGLFNCKNIKNLEFPILKSLGSRSLKDCSSLENITIPVDVKTSNETFSNCNNLYNINFTIPQNSDKNITVDLKLLLLDTWLDHSVRTYKQIRSINFVNIPHEHTITIKNAGADNNTIILTSKIPFWNK